MLGVMLLHHALIFQHAAVLINSYSIHKTIVAVAQDILWLTKVIVVTMMILVVHSTQITTHNGMLLLKLAYNLLHAHAKVAVNSHAVMRLTISSIKLMMKCIM